MTRGSLKATGTRSCWRPCDRLWGLLRSPPWAGVPGGRSETFSRRGPGAWGGTPRLIWAGRMRRGREGGEEAVGRTLGSDSERAGPARGRRGPRGLAEGEAMAAEPRNFCEGPESSKAGGGRGGAGPPAAHAAPQTVTWARPDLAHADLELASVHVAFFHEVW